MADEEHHDTEFDSADAGASTTYPNTAGAVRKNGFIVIKGRPCKVSEEGVRVESLVVAGACVRAMPRICGGSVRQRE